MLDTKNINCPYCGEQIEIVIDTSVLDQQYIEDCEVCCRPIELSVQINNNDSVITPRHENE
ncbi:MAG: CPXCG motif-containing cysteine-rich protein [Pseudomonadota bacterium]